MPGQLNFSLQRLGPFAQIVAWVAMGIEYRPRLGPFGPENPSESKENRREIDGNRWKFMEIRPFLGRFEAFRSGALRYYDAGTAVIGYVLVYVAYAFHIAPDLWAF